MKEQVKYYKKQYKKAKANGYKGSYTSYAKKMGWVKKPSFTFPGFGSGIDIHKKIGMDGHYQGIGIQDRTTIWTIKYGTINILVKY